MNKVEFRRSLEKMVAANGPLPHEYQDLTNLILRLEEGVREGLIAQGDIRDVLDEFPDPFSEKTLQGRALRKPHGYAGDYEMMESIYSGHVSNDETLANWDRYFQAQAAPQAVRNRKSYFHDVLDRLGGSERTVLKLGVGPGRGMFEWFERTSQPRVTFECVDVDLHAIDYAANLNRKYAQRILFHHQNVFKFMPAPARRYDLIWAAGLFDYFDDQTFVAVAKKFFRHLAPGGEFIIGNFSLTNPTRPYMELFGDWNLHHRTPEALLNLGARIGAAPETLRVGSEPANVNLFLHMGAETERDMVSGIWSSAPAEVTA